MSPRPRPLAVFIFLAALALLLLWRWQQGRSASRPAPLPVAQDQPSPTPPGGPRSETCQQTSDCGPGFFCREGTCSEYLYDGSCQKDADCLLVNTANGYGCCGQGACEIPELSQNSWISVNRQTYAQTQAQFCPSKEDCGPRPLCPDQQGDRGDWEALCLQGSCVKASR